MAASAPRDEGVRTEVGYIAPIEGLRGVAVLVVMAFHFALVRDARFDDPWVRLLDSSLLLEVVVRNGSLGVDLFFLITGFLLVLPWLRHAEQGRPAPSARAFYERRARRILPAYYIHLLILFFLLVPLLRGLEFWRLNLQYMFANLSAHVFLVHYFSPATSASVSVNGALWTLSLEAQYYLLLPLIAPLFARAPWRTAAALSVVALAWRWLSMHDLEWLVRRVIAVEPRWNISEATARHLLYTQLPGYLAHFAAGMLVGRAWLRRRGRPVTRSRALAWLALAGAALLALYGLLVPGGWNAGEFTWLPLVVAMAVAMVALVASGVPQANLLLANRPLAFVGRVSYSSYLYHLPILLLWNAHGPELTGWWLAFPLYVATVLAVAWLSYRYVEMGTAPFLRARAAPDAQRGDDGEGLEQRHAPENLRVAPGVHEQAEDERGDGEARVNA